jgi:superfamily II DNA or RNA helicase
VSVEQGVLHATVRGSDNYVVWIEPDGSRLKALCSCPYFLDHVEICKHIWAVILAAEVQSIPLVPPGIANEDVYLEPVDPDVPDDFDDDGADVPVWQPAPTRAPSTIRGPAPPPPWRLMLDVVSSVTAPPTTGGNRLAPGQLLYVVDYAATAASGTLVLELMTRDRKINGEWGKPRPLTVTAADVRSHPDPVERQILERLLGARPHVDWGGYDAYGTSLSRLQLRGILVSEVLPLICATGRCVLRKVPLKPDRTTAETIPTTGGAPVGLEGGVARATPVGSSWDPRAAWNARGTSQGGGWDDRGRWDPHRWKPPRPEPPTLTPIEWDGGDAWCVTISIRPAEAERGYEIAGWLARGDERMALTDPAIMLADGILFTDTRAARLNAIGAMAWLAALVRTGRVVAPPEARDELIDALLASSPKLAEIPDDLRIEVVAAEPRPRLRLKPGRYRPDRLQAELAFDYEGATVVHDEPRAVVRATGSTRAIRRNADAERRALDALHARGCRNDWNQDTGTRTLQLAAHLLPRIVRPLLDEGWQVEVSGRPYRIPGPATLSVRSGIDWFELHGNVAFGDQQAPLPALLAAVARGETFVTLGDGTLGLLPEEWLQRYGRLARLGSMSGDHLRFKSAQVALLDALIGAQPEASWDATFARARADLQAFEGIAPADPPATFRGTLRGYQREGLGWLLFLKQFGFGGCLADDMGLGKTVMVLALLAGRRDVPARDSERVAPRSDRHPPRPTDRLPPLPSPARHDGTLPSLVVAPRSVVFNWRQEAARFAPGLRVLEYVGGGRSAMRETFGDYDVVLTTYGTLRRDAPVLSDVEFDYVILDEAQAIKNASSVSAKTTRVLKARHRLALSGTPIENHLRELWSLFEFLNPGLLGAATAFDRVGAGSQDDEAIALLSRGLRPFILRRTKEQVAKELPPKTEQTLYCELEKPQRALYDELREHYRRTLLNGTKPDGFGRAKLQVLEALLRLRQAACHPGLIDRGRSKEASAKLDVLVPRVTEAVEEGHKTLVFSQFTSLLAILRQRLDAAGVTYEYLDGRTRDREERVERFQTDPACRLFLISLKAGGLGLNLTAAEYVFLLDPWWNPAVEAQAMDRAHRIGQSRHVFGYRLIARDTVEERVLELQQRKRKLADAILTADNSLIRDLKREDLELLLS